MFPNMPQSRYFTNFDSSTSSNGVDHRYTDNQNHHQFSDVCSLPIETPPPPIFCNDNTFFTTLNGDIPNLTPVNPKSSPPSCNGGNSSCLVNDGCRHRVVNGYVHLCSGGRISQQSNKWDDAANYFIVSSNNGFNNTTTNDQEENSPSTCSSISISIVDQPVERCRFRYKAEQGPHGALRAASSPAPKNAGAGQKSVPKVKVEHLAGGGGGGKGYVVASLWTNEPTPRPHVNELWGAECEQGVCKVKLDQSTMTASFPNLGIMRQKEKEITNILLKKYIRDYEKFGTIVTDDLKDQFRERAHKETATMKDCLHCVRLGFQAFLVLDSNTSNTTEIVCPIILSNPIYNSQNPGFSELRIAEIDRTCGTCLGGDVVWMRCATKVKRDQVKIKFCDLTLDWEEEASFAPTDVYEQILIIFKTPPYHNANISSRVVVHVRLFRPSDGDYSPPVEFVYLPTDGGPWFKRARRLVDGTSDETPPTWSGGGQGGPNSAPTNGNGYFHTFSSNNQQLHYFGNHEPKGSDFTSHGACCSRKRQSTSPNPQGSTNSKLRSLDSGIGMLRSMESAADPPGGEQNLSCKIENLSLIESSKKFLSDQQRLEHVLNRQFDALWDYCASGDLTSVVQANKELLSKQDENGNTLLHVCARNKQAFALKTLLKVLDGAEDRSFVLNIQNLKGQTPLHLAVKFGDADSVHYLVQSKADSSRLDVNGNSVAHYMAHTFNDSVYREILFPPKINLSAESAANNNVNVDEINNDGFCPLHLAVKKNKLSLVENLLEAKVDLNIQERSTGKTALHLSVDVNDLDILKLLLAQPGISIDKEMHDGTTALQLAVIQNRSHEMMFNLLNAGADACLKSSCRATLSLLNDTNDENVNCSNDDERVEKRSAVDFAAQDDPKLISLLKNPSTFEPENFNVESIGGVTVSTSTQHVETSLSYFEHPTTSNNGVNKPKSTVKAVQQTFDDELSSLEFLTRLRLGKLLDKNDKWVRLIEILLPADQASQTVDCIRVCSFSEVGGSGSPTSFLLDQLEQWPHIKIPTLESALRDMGEQEGVQLLKERKRLM